ncbi:hypothetical protein DFA_10324 [Cavenderia fasciculata]|uniref:Zinc-binding loop region of homing endonuclease domain-containing protein n=1 Tax=Cavenderia fasciculata TaxID=261658 RepID=F4Q9W6_CACFS|nr:uncharacterized protein DFA_10324 [Cavenderia fasciculata]EGG15485.1 hypothetical protein DFA_10324 [Cavenderia fasciculata]|eukprot:XP_004354227.1 hypothetical protein DFA_10324 [Cavenderia fasciculata]
MRNMFLPSFFKFGPSAGDSSANDHDAKIKVDNDDNNSFDMQSQSSEFATQEDDDDNDTMNQATPTKPQSETIEPSFLSTGSSTLQTNRSNVGTHSNGIKRNICTPPHTPPTTPSTYTSFTTSTSSTASTAHSNKKETIGLKGPTSKANVHLKVTNITEEQLGELMQSVDLNSALGDTTENGRCMVCHHRSIGGKLGLNVQHLAFMNQKGVAETKKIPIVKSANSLSISTICATKQCINPQHLISEISMSHRTRVKCHAKIKRILKLSPKKLQRQKIVSVIEKCPHKPQCLPTLPFHKDKVDQESDSEEEEEEEESDDEDDVESDNDEEESDNDEEEGEEEEEDMENLKSVKRKRSRNNHHASHFVASTCRVEHYSFDCEVLLIEVFV